MTPEEVLQEYQALKRHFSSTYDYHRYGGKLRTSTTSASYQRDKLFYQKVGKHKDPKRFLLANILHDKKVYIRSLAYDAEAERIHMEYVARVESLSYIFKQDLKKLDDNLNSNLQSLDCYHPKIIVLYLSKQICLETLCIVAKETAIVGNWERVFPYDPVIEEIIFKIKKYTPFITFDRIKFRKFIADEFLDR